MARAGDHGGLPDQGGRGHGDGLRRHPAHRDRRHHGPRRPPRPAGRPLERRLPVRPAAPARQLLRRAVGAARLGSHRRGGAQRRLPRAGRRPRGPGPLRRGDAAPLPPVGAGHLPPHERARRRRHRHLAPLRRAVPGVGGPVRRRHPLEDAGALDVAAVVRGRARRGLRAAERPAPRRRPTTTGSW